MEHVPQDFGSWTTVDVINKGGQGTAYKAVFGGISRLRQLSNSLRNLTGSLEKKDLFSQSYLLAEILRSVGEIRALKVLHQLGNDEAGKRARARMKNEILGMEKVIHPNLLRLFDFDKDNLQWYVTEYQPGGTLTQAKEKYTGRPLKALRALRGLVEGVALIHEAGAVHRDIKPDNIFLSASNGLVLGDFGLVFFSDQGERLSETMENVGSRDWMPGWAISMRLEDVKPTFDVFGLGKTLYSMVSRKQHLRLWYHKEPEFDLLTMFPGDLGMEWVNRILEKSVVEHEKQMGYRNASEMLVDIEIAISEISRRPSVTPDDIGKRCVACGLGKYEPTCAVDFPFLPKKSKRTNYGILTCPRCGHAELFACEPDEKTPWELPKLNFPFDQKKTKGGKPVAASVPVTPQPEIAFHSNAWWRRNDPNPLCMNCKIKGGELIPLKRSWAGFSCIKCGDDVGQIQPPDGWGIAANRWVGFGRSKAPGDARKAGDFDPHENA
jgi:serine/threonine protein kinase